MKTVSLTLAAAILALVSCGGNGPSSRAVRSERAVEEAEKILTSEAGDIAVAPVDGARLLPVLRQAEVKAAEAMKADEKNARAASLLALLRAKMALYSDEEPAGEDKSIIESSLAGATRALERARTNAGVWIDRAEISLTLFHYVGEARAEELRQSAVEDLTYALKLDPVSADGLYARAFAQTWGAEWPFKPSPTSFRESMHLDPPSPELAARNVDLLTSAERDLLDLKHIAPGDARLPDYLDYVRQLLADWRRRKAAVTVMTAGQVFDSWKDAVVLLESDKGSGSGFVAAVAPNIEHGVLILTNRHVVEGASRRFVRVRLKDGRVLPGRVAKLSSDRDLAVVDAPKAEGFGLPRIDSGADAIDVGSRGEAIVRFARGEEAAAVGERIIVIGHPGAQARDGGVVMLSWTLTEGALSAFRDGGNLLQHDAPTNPGNSGGPILDLHGRVVGVVQSLVRGADPRLPAGHTLEGVGLGETAENARAFLHQTTREMSEGMPRPVAPSGRMTRYRGGIDFLADFGKNYTLAFETDTALQVQARLFGEDGGKSTLLWGDSGTTAPGQPLTLSWTCPGTGWYVFSLVGRDGAPVEYSAKVEAR